MRDIKYRIAGLVHYVLKLLIGRNRLFHSFIFVDVERSQIQTYKKQRNETMVQVFPTENRVAAKSTPFKRSFKLAPSFNCYSVNEEDIMEKWSRFISRSRIPPGYSNTGLCHGGFILNRSNGWCLPSWIWTNGAVVRHYLHEDAAMAKVIAERLYSLQLDCGGWCVRFDYDQDGEVPIIAPNDSAYIANHAMLGMYRQTREQKWLKSAVRCANWIIETSREDGLVWTGKNKSTGIWDTNKIIVDIGFCAGLFGELYELTKEQDYLDFGIKFCDRYIDLFFDDTKGLFVTSINGLNERQGGYFARGQAWAFEGLLPIFRHTNDIRIRQVLDRCFSTMLKNQRKDGSWHYNLSKKYLGTDCKGTPVIAKALLEYANLTNNPSKEWAERALSWCKSNTVENSDASGGIFSYSMEGAIVHTHYSSTALVYSTIYALELQRLLHGS